MLQTYTLLDALAPRKRRTSATAPTAQSKRPKIPNEGDSTVLSLSLHDQVMHDPDSSDLSDAPMDDYDLNDPFM